MGSSSDVDDGLGHGLGLIIDKLKNIETKLDELKTIDQVAKVVRLSPISHPSTVLNSKGRKADYLKPIKTTALSLCLL